MEKKKFRLADVILSVICVVFVAEAAAPVASIGNSQYFWWIFMARIVIALGGNALGNNPKEQQEMIEAACPALVGLISQGHVDQI